MIFSNEHCLILRNFVSHQHNIISCDLRSSTFLIKDVLMAGYANCQLARCRRRSRSKSKIFPLRCRDDCLSPFVSIYFSVSVPFIDLYFISKRKIIYKGEKRKILYKGGDPCYNNTLEESRTLLFFLKKL